MHKPYPEGCKDGNNIASPVIFRYNRKVCIRQRRRSEAVFRLGKICQGVHRCQAGR